MVLILVGVVVIIVLVDIVVVCGPSKWSFIMFIRKPLNFLDRKKKANDQDNIFFTCNSQRGLPLLQWSPFTISGHTVQKKMSFGIKDKRAHLHVWLYVAMTQSAVAVSKIICKFNFNWLRLTSVNINIENKVNITWVELKILIAMCHRNIKSNM